MTGYQGTGDTGNILPCLARAIGMCVERDL